MVQMSIIGEYEARGTTVKSVKQNGLKVRVRRPVFCCLRASVAIMDSLRAYILSDSLR